MELCCEHCGKVELNWIVLHNGDNTYNCNVCGKRSNKLKPLEVGQKVSFNWRDGVMMTEVEKIKDDVYFCFMSMTGKIEAFKRYELSDIIYKKALKTAFRITGQY